MIDELTPEQMTGHIAAMRAEPWGEDRADRRTAYMVFWMYNLWGSSSEETDKPPEAEDFLAQLSSFIAEGTTEAKKENMSPDEAVKAVKRMFT